MAISSSCAKLGGKAESFQTTEQPEIHVDMTDQSNHPTSGRRRRHKSSAPGIKSGLTVFSQPRGILTQPLCECVRENGMMKNYEKSVGDVIARESLRDESSKVIYCTEAVVALMTQSRLSSPRNAQHKDDITTVKLTKRSWNQKVEDFWF